VTIRVKDLPALRRSLLAAERDYPLDDDPAVRQAFLHGLESASLWWVSPDMTRLAVGAADTLPDWTPMFARPDTTGLLVWAGRTLDTIAPSASDGLRGVFWQMIGEQCRVSLYCDPTPNAPTGVPLEEFGTFEFDAATPYSVLEAQATATVAPVIQMIGATWILMQQPTVAERKTIERSSSRRRSGVAGAPSPTAVQVIDLRRLHDRADEPQDADSTGREYRHRWMVRGHWRQQAVGPGRKHRKPVYVPPHIKGPDGAPLVTERVHVWRR
jgi:hypothetical protein